MNSHASGRAEFLDCRDHDSSVARPKIENDIGLPDACHLQHRGDDFGWCRDVNDVYRTNRKLRCLPGGHHHRRRAQQHGAGEERRSGANSE